MDGVAQLVPHDVLIFGVVHPAPPEGDGVRGRVVERVVHGDGVDQQVLRLVVDVGEPQGLDVRLGFGHRVIRLNLLELVAGPVEVEDQGRLVVDVPDQ
jgi:hypothetical protein